MKVILAGLPKTGTKSIAKAFRILGFNVYDVIENISYFGDNWLKIMNEGCELEDFRQMYNNVDATCDLPMVHYWEEVFKAFPDAKVILMIRDDEDTWCESFTNQLDIMANSRIFSWMSYLSPTNRKVHQILNQALRVTFGLPPIMGEKYKPNGQILKIAYRNHNTRVIQVVPKQQLLVFHCKMGWKSLCEFLECDVPDQPFPHENKRGSFGKEETLKERPEVMQIKKEITRSISILATFFLVFVIAITTTIYYVY